MSYGVGRRRGSNLVWLWLWCRLTAVAPIQPLAWEPPNAMSAALRKKKKKEISVGVSTVMQQVKDRLCLCLDVIPGPEICICHRYGPKKKKKKQNKTGIYGYMPLGFCGSFVFYVFVCLFACFF